MMKILIISVVVSFIIVTIDEYMEINKSIKKAQALIDRIEQEKLINRN